MRKLLIMMLLIVSQLASAQIAQANDWVDLGPEGTIVSKGPLTAKFQACADVAHCTPVVISPSYPIEVDWINASSIAVWGLDPLPYSNKHIGVIKAAQVQTFTVNGSQVIVPAIVPSFVPSSVPPATVKLPILKNCTAYFGLNDSISYMRQLPIFRQASGLYKQTDGYRVFILNDDNTAIAYGVTVTTKANGIKWLDYYCHTTNKTNPPSTDVELLPLLVIR